MDWIRVVLAVLVAGLASSMTDWFFGGILFHEKYGAYPEIWRHSSGGGETKAIAWSIGLSFIACAVFVLILELLGIAGWERTLGLALLVWGAGCVPVLITNALFIKLHPLVVVSNSLGWLVKLGLFAAASVLLLP